MAANLRARFPGNSQLTAAADKSPPSAAPEVGRRSLVSRSTETVAPPAMVDYGKFLTGDPKGQVVLGSVIAKAIDVIIDLYDQNPSDIIVIPPQPPIPIDGHPGFPRPEKREWRSQLGLHRIQWAAVVEVTGTKEVPNFVGKLLIEAIPAVSARGEAKFRPLGVVEIALDFSIENAPADRDKNERKDRRYDLQASTGGAPGHTTFVT